MDHLPDAPSRGAPDLSYGELQARLDAKLRATDLGAVVAASGITTVALNERGELTEYRPDRTSVLPHEE